MAIARPVYFRCWEGSKRSARPDNCPEGCPFTARCIHRKDYLVKYSLKSTGGGCTLTAADFQNTTAFPLPMRAGDLTALLSNLLADPERPYVESGLVMIERGKAGVTIRTNAGAFDIPWSHLFAIEGAPDA